MIKVKGKRQKKKDQKEKNKTEEKRKPLYSHPIMIPNSNILLLLAFKQRLVRRIGRA